jgi:hypothetical protein
MENRPGTFADVMEALGKANVNVEGLQGMPCAGQGVGQFVTNNADGAARALGAAGIQHTTRQVLLLTIPNRPGEGGRVARALANAGVNVDGVYARRVVLGVDVGRRPEVARKLGMWPFPIIEPTTAQCERTRGKEAAVPLAVVYSGQLMVLLFVLHRAMRWVGRSSASCGNLSGGLRAICARCSSDGLSAINWRARARQLRLPG